MPVTRTSAFRSRTSESRPSSLVSRGSSWLKGCDARLAARLLLPTNVDGRRGIVADEHRRQADLAAELHDVPPDVGAHPRCERLPVHQRPGHGRGA